MNQGRLETYRYNDERLGKNSAYFEIFKYIPEFGIVKPVTHIVSLKLWKCFEKYGDLIKMLKVHIFEELHVEYVYHYIYEVRLDSVPAGDLAQADDMASADANLMDNYIYKAVKTHVSNRMVKEHHNCYKLLRWTW